MAADLRQVRSYYDSQLADKLRDFIEGNDRIERAWQTIARWAPRHPRRILEVGCGVGHTCARLSRCWPRADVVGLDVSPASLDAAGRLFGSPRIRFVEGPLIGGLLDGVFDLIVLMDVYEHIARDDRPALHEALAPLLSDTCRVILTFPTPRILEWSRRHHPEAVQPVDEDVDFDAIAVFSHSLGVPVLLYQEVDVWHVGDYAHAVLGPRAGIEAVPGLPPKGVVRRRIERLLLGDGRRATRLAFVHERLGRDAYPG